MTVAPPPPLKPSHKAIQAYYDALAAHDAHGVTIGARKGDGHRSKAPGASPRFPTAE